MDYIFLCLGMIPLPHHSFPIFVEETGIFHLRVVYIFQVQTFLLC